MQSEIISPKTVHVRLVSRNHIKRRWFNSRWGALSYVTVLQLQRNQINSRNSRAWKKCHWCRHNFTTSIWNLSSVGIETGLLYLAGVQREWSWSVWCLGEHHNFYSFIINKWNKVVKSRSPGGKERVGAQCNFRSIALMCRGHVIVTCWQSSSMCVCACDWRGTEAT